MLGRFFGWLALILFGAVVVSVAIFLLYLFYLFLHIFFGVDFL